MIEEEFSKILRKTGVDFILNLPCEKIKSLISILSENFDFLTISREEEGIGISAGLYMAGKRPAMLIQSSGFGNCINALMSLTKCYNLPLLMIISWRGVFGERIEAQKPLGIRLPKLLDVLDINYLIFNGNNFDDIENFISEIFEREEIGAILLKPDIWKKEEDLLFERPKIKKKNVVVEEKKAELTRYEILKEIKDILEGRIVVSNLGFPSRELYSVLDQPTNFYMLGSMGLASSIALGIALTGKEVVAIDGDGSILMNPSTLFTAISSGVGDLTILAIDNGVYGSTGNQPTASLTSDLQLLSISAGFEKTFRVSKVEEIRHSLSVDGTKFIHVIAKPGNARVPVIPMKAVEIKDRFMSAIK